MTLTRLGDLGMHSAADLRAAGRARRRELPRSAHAEYVPNASRDPLGIIERQNLDRLPDLIPVRTARMRESVFAFYRGTAAIQAADLAGAPTTGAHIVVAGDAHLGNFGFYRSPQRSLVFDMNDFDEAAVAPWEWDVKRLATSVIVAARARGVPDADGEAAAVSAVAAYRSAIRDLDSVPALDRFYRRIDLDAGIEPPAGLADVVRAARRAAKRRTSSRVIARSTVRTADGGRMFVEDPPVLTHVDDRVRQAVARLFDEYLLTTRADVALLLTKYRVVSGQRILQAVSDPFLGYLENEGRAYYVRQFRDGNSSVDIESLDDEGFSWYTRACAWVLARGHAQSPALPFIAGYLGSADAFDRAIVRWALAYADQADADHEAFDQAVGAGRFPSS